MGLATQMIHWDEDFCALLGERGYRVIRFDNRDIGHSTKIDSAGCRDRADDASASARSAYRLADMANDTVGLLDHLGIDAAHVVGASMGGMIAQQLAIDHPGRVLSLCSIMSTTGNRRYRFPRWRAFGAADGEAAVEPRGLRRAGGEDLQGDRLARATRWTRRAFASSSAAPTTAASTRPASRASCTRSTARATARRRCARSTCRRWSSTAPPTRSSARSPARRRRARSPGRACA